VVSALKLMRVPVKVHVSQLRNKLFLLIERLLDNIKVREYYYG
jgi:hypothetical protein